jgi:hypothetical protein
MRLTRDQIVRMYQATGDKDADAVFYAEEGEGGRLLFGELELVEKKRPLKLTNGKTEKELVHA